MQGQFTRLVELGEDQLVKCRVDANSGIIHHQLNAVFQEASQPASRSVPHDRDLAAIWSVFDGVDDQVI